jgi:hypothetical protein
MRTTREQTGNEYCASSISSEDSGRARWWSDSKMCTRGIDQRKRFARPSRTRLPIVHQFRALPPAVSVEPTDGSRSGRVGRRLSERVAGRGMTTGVEVSASATRLSCH